MQITRTKIDTSKKTNKKIIHISDIHFYKKYPMKKLNEIIDLVKKEDPDFVCITGDIIDKPDVTKLKEIKDYIKFYETVSNISKIIVILGNHDLLDDKKYIPEYDEFLIHLKQIKNVYLLRGEKQEFDDIAFLSYEPEKHTYIKEEQKLNQNEERLIKKLPKASTGKYNVVLMHSPITIIKLKDRVYMKDYDLFLCGHTHDGLLPLFLSKNMNIHYGIISPTKILFPKEVRGIYNTSPKIIINGGIVKFSKTAHLFQKLDFLYPSCANVIEIHEKL